MMAYSHQSTFPSIGPLLHYFFHQLLLGIILLGLAVIYFNVSRRRRTSDDDLFKQPPQLEDCPLCCFRLPSWIRVIDTIHVVGKLYAVGAFMRLR